MKLRFPRWFQNNFRSVRLLMLFVGSLLACIGLYIYLGLRICYARVHVNFMVNLLTFSCNYENKTCCRLLQDYHFLVGTILRRQQAGNPPCLPTSTTTTIQAILHTTTMGYDDNHLIFLDKPINTNLKCAICFNICKDATTACRAGPSHFLCRMSQS